MVRRLEAVAELDERPEAADAIRARAAEGDGDSRWLLTQWEQGRVLVARVRVTVVAEDDDGKEVSAAQVLSSVWLEHDDPPRVEAQVADVAPGELPDLAAALRGRGVAVDDNELAASFLHIELGDDLRRALAGR